MTKVILAAACALIGASAFAAPAAPVVQPTGTALTVNGGATTAKVADVKAADKKITISYLAENGTPMSTANRNNMDNLESQQNIGIAYKLSATQKVQVRQYFHYNMTDKTQTDEWSLGDPAVQYTDSEMLKIGSAPILGYARLYLPGTDYAQDVGKYELRLVGSADQKLSGKTSMNYSLGTRLYGYTQEDNGQRGLRMIPGIKASYEATKGVSPYVALLGDFNFRHTGKGISMDDAVAKYRPVNADTAFYYLGVAFQPIENVGLDLYVETADNLRGGDDFVWLNEASSAYYLDVSVSL